MLKKLLFALLATSATVSMASAEPVRIGLQPWLGYGPLWVAAEKGYFEDRGVEVELINFNWDQDVNAALVSGNIEVQAAATNTMINLLNSGIELKGFMIMDAAYEADAIIAGEGVDSVSDLEGKSVAYELGATSDLLLNYALRENDLSIDDIDPVPMGASEAGLAAIAGRVDAAVSYEPYISTALAEDNNFKVIYDASAAPGLISDLLVAETSYIEENKDTLAAIVKAWDDAVSFIRDNPDEGGQIIANAVGSPIDQFQVAFEGVRLFNLEENIEQFSGPFQEAYDSIGSIMMEINPDNVPSYPNVSEALDTSIVDLAAE
ncbi:ABC transporter substrate-binding protein [Chelativorans sp. YIM 93263]|uniref:ABC transporter substrate-binding protein n=1 Tax=Chelativorans sp. YIM 93263 TaxID=2906648 RepID=UPI0023795C18|nr:ABC transporter substrate-binding protein [Chelativorans sp. YIM 93263]